MYREDYFYGLSDILQFNVRASFLHNRITSEERGILKVFKRDEEVIVIEFFQGKDEIIKDTRKDKTNKRTKSRSSCNGCSSKKIKMEILSNMILICCS